MIKLLKSKKTLLIFILLISVLTIVGCESQVTEKLAQSGEGKIALALAGPDQIGNISGFNSNQISAIGDYWPRDVNTVLTMLKGYVLRIEGNGVTVYKKFMFGPEQNQMTVVLDLPVGQGYTVTLLAIGPNRNPLLLGAGRASGVEVSANQTTSLDIMMEPFKYDIQSDSDRFENLIFVYRIQGPFLADLFQAGTAGLIVYGSNTVFTTDYQGTQLQPDSFEEVDPEHWAYQIPVNQTDSLNPYGAVYFQAQLTIKSRWLTNNISFNYLTPSLEAGEEPYRPYLLD